LAHKPDWRIQADITTPDPEVNCDTMARLRGPSHLDFHRLRTLETMRRCGKVYRAG
jgi:hypothetical protein